MNLSSSGSSSRRRLRQIKEIGVIVAVLAFYGFYRIPLVQSVMDRAVTPAIAGMTLGYGKLTSFFYRISGLNFGFVAIPPDPEFLFSVQLATYINQKQASPLLDMASDTRLPIEKRERALRSLTKFESTSDWIQPFLNELPKGGLLGLYESEAPLLDELIKKIRSEGGIHQDLVRAYAEVVFSFMLQVPDAIVRKHALSWISDIVSENALFLITPRFERESDPGVRKAIDAALLDVRAVSEPQNALQILVPFYKKPPWPSLRLPLAVVLSRLGYSNSVDYLRFILKSQTLSDDEMVPLRVALSGTPYPKKLSISEQERTVMARNERMREEQRQQAWIKYQRMLRQDQMKKMMLARARTEDDAQNQSYRTRQPSQSQTEIEEAPLEEKIKEPELKENAVREPEPRIRMVLPEKKEEARVHDVIQETDKGSSNLKDEEADIIIEDDRPFSGEAPAARPEERVPPKSFFAVPGAQTPDVKEPEPPVESAPQYAKLTEQNIGLPEEMLPPLEEMAKPPKSLMNYIDGVFEVKKNDAAVYENPGSGPTDVMLPVGTKGKADLEVLIGEEHWYQVKTTLGNGWVNGSALSVFNLSPTESVPAVSERKEPSSQQSLDGAREESTYFEANIADAPIYSKPGAKSKQVGTLTPDVAYLAIKSEKVGVNRWFLLQIRSGETAWAEGTDLQLAAVQQPVPMSIPTQPLSLRDKKSAFTAEWVVAGVKGVGVYSRPSIAGKMIQLIDPPTVYKVVELSAGGGKEWYRIELPGKKEGWVQALDVSLTKPDSP